LANCGFTRQTPLWSTVTRCIGKVANRWEEQSVLGYDPGEQIEYGLARDGAEAFVEQLRAATKKHGVTKVSSAMGISRRYVYKLLNGESKASEQTVNRLAKVNYWQSENLVCTGIHTSAKLFFPASQWLSRQKDLTNTSLTCFS